MWLVYINSLVALIVIIDPVGAALIFHSLVPEKEKRHRRIMAIKTVLISCGLIMLFGFYGEAMLSSLGISMGAFRISGGILLFYTAFELVSKQAQYAQSTEIMDISVFPMSIPLVAGPGSLTLSILLFSGANGEQEHLPVIAAIVTVFAITYVCFLLSRYIKNVVGRTGDDILRRFLGIVLAALSIQFIVDGFKQVSA
ncbi:MAG: MarC family protein [Gammaproteobacteria bacterium]|nr:MarC family protein [Gammaproteobacteria bacterium]